MNIKLNDIYRWSWTDDKLKHLNHGNNGGTTYWCVSQICVVKQYKSGELYLEDTYWHGNSNRVFDLSQIGKNIELEYLGNFDELVEFKDDVNFYDEKEILNLNHPNSSRGNIYIKRGVKRSLEKMKNYAAFLIGEKEREISYLKNSVERLKVKLSELSEENLDKVYF